MKLKKKEEIFIFLLLVQTLGVDNTFRRKFDREEYLERAREEVGKIPQFM